jgi:FAD/FMN-containing dehydrogenase
MARTTAAANRRARYNSGPMSAGPPHGRLLRRGEPGYEEARRDAVWNSLKPARFPDRIVLAVTSDDVVWAVRAAAADELQVTVRSGGHSWYGNHLRDGGLLIDVSRLTQITVDPGARTAAVGPGTHGRDLDAAVFGHDLFFPVGHCGTVGLGGFTLGGGYGWNSRAFGPACLNLRAIDVVLAGGELVHADQDTHPELLWAARGCGPGFFGVVTGFHFELHRRPRMLRSGDVYPLALHDQVLGWALELLPSLPPEVELSVRVGHSALAGGEPALTVTGLAFAPPDSDPEAAPALLQPLSTCPAAAHAITRFTTPVAAMPDLHDRGADGPPIRWDVDGIWTDAPAAEIIPAAERAGLKQLPGEHSFVLWMLWGGHPERADACWSIQAPLYLSPNAGWEDPADDERQAAWVDNALAGLQPYSRGVQFSDANLSARAGRGLTPEAAERVERIRARYDPGGLFATYMRPAWL